MWGRLSTCGRLAIGLLKAGGSPTRHENQSAARQNGPRFFCQIPYSPKPVAVRIPVARPPAQIRACAANAHGSYLEYLAQTAPSEMGAGFLAQADSGQSESGSAPTSTGCADCAAATLIASSALRSFAATSRSFAVMRFPTVLRVTVSFPLLWIVLQICVNPRKLNVSGFPAPSRFRNRPNSIRRVFSACNSNPNSAIRSRNRVGKLSASSRYWNPGTWRVAPGNLTPRLSQNRT